jgi:hypothetical protein
LGREQELGGAKRTTPSEFPRPAIAAGRRTPGAEDPFGLSRPDEFDEAVEKLLAPAKRN